MVWGWKKPRSKYGRFMDEHGIEQEKIIKGAKISRNTVSKLCNDKEYIPSPKTMKKAIDFAKKIDPLKKMDDFFDI
ncbi:helix-turn-helix domain-containing protein [Schinkia sp. CFF1]